MKASLFAPLFCLITSAPTVAGFAPLQHSIRGNHGLSPKQQLQQQGHIVTSRNRSSSPQPTCSCSAAARSSSNNNNNHFSDCFAANEFSRLIDPERVLRIGTASSNRNRREYRLTIEASDEECQALAQRFDLPALGPLSAEAVLRPSAAAVSSSSLAGVEVEGSIWATLTQRCVRTNEDFSVNVEFPLYAIVRPVMPLQLMASGGGVTVTMDDDDDDVETEEDLYAALNDQTTNQRRNINNKNRPPSLENLDVFQLQQLLQDDGEDDELGDVLMEDQAIYPTGGQLDVGELVAQLFWLQLDPYPKKPGTEPIQRSITG